MSPGSPGIPSSARLRRPLLRLDWRVPHGDDIRARPGEAAAVRTEGHPPDEVLVAIQREQQLTALAVPEPHVTILPGRPETLAVRTHRNRVARHSAYLNRFRRFVRGQAPRKPRRPVVDAERETSNH